MYCFVDAFYGFHAFLDFVIRGEGDDRAFRFRACARARGLMARAASAACVVRADPTAVAIDRDGAVTGSSSRSEPATRGRP